jgi:hypothetical protein
MAGTPGIGPAAGSVNGACDLFVCAPNRFDVHKTSRMSWRESADQGAKRVLSAR